MGAVLNALYEVISIDLQQPVFEVLSSILQIGNLEFEEKDECILSASSHKFAENAAKLLCIDVNELASNLLIRKMTIKGDYIK